MICNKVWKCICKYRETGDGLRVQADKLAPDDAQVQDAIAPDVVQPVPGVTVQDTLPVPDVKVPDVIVLGISTVHVDVVLKDVVLPQDNITP